ncbi:hypothetical protein P3W45_000703 [Vairimorpha bombi]
MILPIFYTILCTRTKDTLTYNTSYKTNLELLTEMNDIIIDINEKMRSVKNHNLFIDITREKYSVNNPYGIQKLFFLQKTDVYKFSWEGHEFVKINHFVIPSTLFFNILLNDVLKVLKNMRNYEAEVLNFIKKIFPKEQTYLRNRVLVQNFYKKNVQNIVESIDIFIDVFDNLCTLISPKYEYLKQFDTIFWIFYEALTCNINKHSKALDYWREYFKFTGDIELDMFDDDNHRKIIQCDFQLIFCCSFLYQSIRGNLLKD